MATETARRNSDGESDSVVAAADRISKLPDPIVHHILSFVPTLFVVRMSFVSRRWNRVWLSVPNLHFFNNDPKFVENCLNQRAMHDISDSAVTSFKLRTDRSASEFGSGLSNWLSSNTVQNCIKDLEISLQWSDAHCLGSTLFRLPSTVLNGRSLTRLDLNGHMEISASNSNINLPSLKSLRLGSVTIDDETLNNLFIGSPLLENCELSDNFSNHLRISSQSLQVLTVLSNCETVEIEAVNLRLLALRCNFGVVFDDFSACRAIRDLSVANASDMKAQNVEDQISKLAFLENLRLGISEPAYGDSQEMTISSRSLKSFSLLKWNDDDFNLALKLETPNLASFTYEGDAKFSMSMETVNHRLDGSFFIGGWDCDTTWYIELLALLSNTNCSWNSVNLYVRKDEELIIPEDLKRICRPSLPNLKHLKVTVTNELTRENELRASLLWLSPSLETLSVKKDQNCSSGLHIF